MTEGLELPASESLTNFEEVFDQQLVCKACTKQYVSPKILPCLHTVCLKCIAQPEVDKKDGRQYIICPLCGVHHRLVHGNTRNLPDAFFINGQLELHNDLSTRRKNTLITCPEHMDPLKVYCETCDKVICRDCTISESHSMHKYRLLSECYTEHHQEIQDELQGIERKMADIETAIAALAIREGMIIDEAEDIKEEIQMHTKQVIEGANRSERQLIHELNSIVQKKTTLLNNQKEEAEKVQKQLKTCKELIEQRLNEWNDQQILMEKQRMMNRMKRLSQFIEPTKFLPLERSDLQFTKDHTTERGIGELSSQTFEKAVLKMPVCSPKVTSTATLALQSNNGSHFSLPSLFVSSFLFSPTCNNIPTTCEITESQQPGEYNISFTSCTRGQYQLIVQVGGMDIHGSPFIFSVTDKPSRILSKINGPRGIAVCENGDIIVAECDANCISIFNKNGKKIEIVCKQKE